MTVRSVKAVNTTVGKTSFVFAVLCSPDNITCIKRTLEECGAGGGMEIGFIHMKDSKKGRKTISKWTTTSLFTMSSHSFNGLCNV